jgi:hypothetical protein
VVVPLAMNASMDSPEQDVAAFRCEARNARQGTIKG